MEIKQVAGNEKESIFEVRFDGTGEFFKAFYKRYPRTMEVTEQDVREEVEEDRADAEADKMIAQMEHDLETLDNEVN